MVAELPASVALRRQLWRGMSSFVEVPARGPEHARLAVLHSNGMCAAYYAPLADRLASGGIASTLFDLPGFAGAPAPPDPTWRGMLDAIGPAIRTQIGEDGVLVGHSLGGLLAVLLAAELPLRALILLEPAVIPWRWLARIAARMYVRQVFTDAPPAFRNRGPWFWRLHDPDGFSPEMKALVLRTHAQTDRALVAALHRELPGLYPLPFDRIGVPTLLIRGASSGRVMAWGQRDLARRLPRAEQVTIAEAGHWLANEQDAALANAIVAFATRGG